MKKMRKNYDERVMQMSAYCALQAKLLELYNPEYDNEAMLKEISPLASIAIRSEQEGNLKSLENLSEELEGRIFDFERQKPETATSQETREIRDLLKKRKREYEELSRNS